MTELPPGWAQTQIGEIARIETGNTPPKSDTTLYAREVCFFKPGDLDIGDVVFASEDMVSQAGAAAGRLLPADTLLVTCIGNLGKSGLIATPAICNQQINAVMPSPAAEPRYLYHWSRTIKPWLEENSSATTVAIINKSRFSKAPINVAPLPEQRRIVARIDSLSSKSKRARDHLDHIPRLVEKYKQAVLAAAFRGEFTRKQYAQKANSWRSVSVGDIAVALFDGPFGSNLKSSDYTQEGIRVVRLENIGNLEFYESKKTFISETHYANLRRHTLQKNDILVSSFIADEMRVCLFPSDLGTPAINKADCFCIRPNSEAVVPRFMELRLASRDAFNILKEEVHGATRPRISLSQLRQFRFEIPSYEEQLEIASRIESAFTWIDRLAADVTSARTLTNRLDQAVLAKAFRGELVSQDPADEPASVLLERVNAGRGAALKSGRGRKKRQ